MSQSAKAGPTDPRLTLAQKALAPADRSAGASGRSLDEFGRTLRRVLGHN